MSRPNPAKLAVFLVVLILLAGLPVVLKGALHVTNYEGDALHLADIALRMAGGERPHVDFMTPIGALAFWPIVVGLRAGLELGHAFVFGQTLFALAASVLVWWAAVSRLSRRLAFGFTACCAILLTSLSHGASGSIVAVSMHYNRWAWVLSFVAVLLVVLRARGRPRPLIDGVVLAVAMAGLAFLKATYFVAFLPALLLIVLMRRDWPLLTAALAAGAVLGAVLFLLMGPAMLTAYLGDLREVTGADVRNQPGLTFRSVAISPAYLVGTLTAFAGMAFLRRSGVRVQGLAVLILLPAFLYVTWQNFGNDPVWLILLSVLLFALRPPRRAGKPPEKDPGVGVALAAFAAIVLSVPMLQNHAAGGLRLLMRDTSSGVLVVPGRAELADLYMPQLPADLVRGRHNLIDPGAPYAAQADRLPGQAPPEFAGEMVPSCQIVTGIPSALAAIEADLAPEEPTIFVADMISSHWLYGGRPPPPGAAPWNYGTLAGLPSAGRILVPLCPISLRARNAILKRLGAEGLTLSLVRETPLYRLYEIGG